MSRSPEVALTDVLARVRRRWSVAATLRWVVLPLGAAASLLVLSAAADRVASPGGMTSVLLWTATAAGVLVCAVWGLVARPVPPTPGQVARFVEERCPELEDALVTAVDALERSDSRPVARSVIDSAAASLESLPLERVLSMGLLRRRLLRAGIAGAVFAGAAWWATAPALRAGAWGAFYLFPDRVTLEVLPGDATVAANTALEVTVRLTGSTWLQPTLRVGDAPEQPMTPGPGGFTLTLDAAADDFDYTVAAAGNRSRTFHVTVIRQPRVDRIDLRYEYPAALGLSSREELDGGDIYGPVGTRVHVLVRADGPVHAGRLTLADGRHVPLRAGDSGLQGTMTIDGDGSYRVALLDAAGVAAPGAHEYFIRVQDDRSPDVRMTRPAADRRVTPLEEIVLEARAEDDVEVRSLEIVYAVSGARETAVRVAAQPSASVEGGFTLMLEDLQVRPGDFVTVYARARDGRASPAATRSDMLFLEVAPLSEEFEAAQTAGGGGPEEESVAQIVEAQKTIIAATWRLDRRGREAGSRLSDDSRSVGVAQGEVRRQTGTLAIQMRRAADARRRRPGVPRPAQPTDETNALGRASDAMGRAQEQLFLARTEAALPHEMTALAELLRAQSEVRRRQVQLQASSGGQGSSRQQRDLSSLFDEELARQQRTNYERPASEPSGPEREARRDLDRVRELAERQDALAGEQQALADRQRELTSEDLQRELERLAREQSELRQKADALARQLRGHGAQDGGERRASTGRALEQASADMRGSASELRRQAPGEASARAERALEQLRALEQALRAEQPTGAEAQALASRLARLQQLKETLAELQQEVARQRALGEAGRAEGGVRRGASPAQGAGEGRGDQPAEAGDAPWAAVENLLEAAKRELESGSPDTSGFNPGRSAPGTEAWKADHAAWDVLKVQLALALESAESDVAGRLRDHRAADRLDAGSTRAVPEQYRTLIERYYRALGGRPPEP